MIQYDYNYNMIWQSYLIILFSKTSTLKCILASMAHREVWWQLHPLNLSSISRSNDRIIKILGPFWSHCLRAHSYMQAPKIFSTSPHSYHAKQAISKRPAEPTFTKTQWSGQEATISASLWFQRWPVGKISYQPGVRQG